MSRSTVVIELAGDIPFSRDLAAGGVFVPGCRLRLSEECDLVVRGANQQIALPARVVYVDDQRGAGLELIGFSPEMKARLAELAPTAPPRLAPGEDGSGVPEPVSSDDDDHLTSPIPIIAQTAGDGVPIVGDADGLDDDDEQLTMPVSVDATATSDHGGVHTNGEPASGPAAVNDAGAPADDATRDHGDDADAVDAADGDADDTGGTRRLARNVNERLRGLTLAAQVKKATSGELSERIVLERLYGKNVWETLLRNPRLTAPEVSRIARYGSLPRVLLEIIVGNNAWLQIPEVRRALLSNPRLATDQVMKILRVTPKHELKLAAIQTAYPHVVRNAAKLLLRDD